MKIIFSIILFGGLITSTVFAQNDSPKPAFSVDIVTPTNKQAGNMNYLLSLSDKDLKNQKYVFYTDSNATVAYVRINGDMVRLTGGSNPENIMAYTAKGYTVTLKLNQNTSNEILNNTEDHISVKKEATLVIYSNSGKSVVSNVIGAQINEIGK